ncbi:hemolysin family protein [soil metagenome]
MTLLGLAVVVALILLNGFFVAGEFAMLAANRNQLEQLAADGNRRAERTREALKDISFHLSGAQLGISIASLLLGFLTEPTIGRAIEPLVQATGVPEQSSLAVSVALALGLATCAQMVIGELVPKNVAIVRPVRLALVFVPPLMVWDTLLRPVIHLLNSAANLTVRAFGVEPTNELAGVRSLEELELLIRSSRDEGTLPEEEFGFLRRSISFGNKVAADALVPRTSIKALPSDATVGDLSTLAAETGFSRFPVYGASLDDIHGVAHIKDTFAISIEERSSTPLAAILKDALIVPESRELESLLVEMQRQRQQMAVVIDEHGGTEGILTIEDVIEEIVGDIEDEHDSSPSAQVTAAPEGVHVVSGMLHPDEVRDATGFEIPEGDYETLAGFLLTLLDHLPEKGEHACYNGWELKVVEMDRRRIARVLLVGPQGVKRSGVSEGTARTPGGGS